MFHKNNKSKDNKDFRRKMSISIDILLNNMDKVIQYFIFD